MGCHGKLAMALILFWAHEFSVLAQVGPPGSQRPRIEYRFDSRTDFANGVVSNRGSLPLLSGNLVGHVQQLAGVLGNGLDLDGLTSYVEVPRSPGLSVWRGLTVDVFVLRESNASQDAIASNGHEGAGQWLLTFYPAGNGLLNFTVRLEGGADAVVEYPVPDTSYLGTWVHVAATYEPAGRLALYWNGEAVAQSELSGQRMARGFKPIRIGDAGDEASRFEGRIDEVRIWPRALEASELTCPLRPRVLVVEYDSNDPTYFDPRNISNDVIEKVKMASDAFVEFQIVDWMETNALPPHKPDGRFDYTAMFDALDVCQRAGKGDIHEVWVWAGPDGGLLEYAINGPWWEAYGIGVGMPACDIQMVVMGFNYERQLPEAMHSFGHRLEHIYRHHWFVDWDAFDGQFYRYGYSNEDQPPLVDDGQHCGNVHFPPNADAHYEYDSDDEVFSNADDWRSDLSGDYQPLTCAAWGCTHEGFLFWWMSRMPGPRNTNGAGGTRLPNWWTTVVE